MRPTFALLSCLLAVACGGSTVPVGTGSSPDGGGSSSGGSSSGGSSSGGSSSGGSSGCTTDGDCHVDYTCGFPAGAACAAKGTCFATAGRPTCASYSPGCACDGSEINVACQAFPMGYVSKPLLHTGACSPTVPTPTPCTTGAECPPDFACGFPQADACAAKGTCFDTRGVALCNAYLPGCACDGSLINTVCGPLPAGYVSKPLRHPGVCTDAG